VIAAGANTLGDLVMARAREHHARTALWVGGETLAYGEFVSEGAKVASAICAVSPKACVILDIPQGPADLESATTVFRTALESRQRAPGEALAQS
jgi:hypothetical protein